MAPDDIKSTESDFKDQKKQANETRSPAQIKWEKEKASKLRSRPKHSSSPVSPFMQDIKKRYEQELSASISPRRATNNTPPPVKIKSRERF